MEENEGIEKHKKMLPCLTEIERYRKEREQRILHDALLEKVRQIKHSTWFELIIVSCGIHFLFYIFDIITDLINGLNYWDTGICQSLFMLGDIGKLINIFNNPVIMFIFVHCRSHRMGSVNLVTDLASRTLFWNL